ncbi:MAG: hypothetical protein K9H64_00710 [Bacteroidales bacterium]|nr:hypothetical protein [Bacteroidales bacterium]MCF8457574.1 hypothetical protein [Bacteroidales bacterium]
MNIILSSCLLFLSFGICAQTKTNEFTIPAVDVKNDEGISVSTEDIIQKEGTYIILFWKSCCPINKILMDGVTEMMDAYDIQDSLTVYAICVDDSRSFDRARTLALSSDWPFKFLFDVNSDFKRAMSVMLTPSFFLIKNGQIIMRTNGYDFGQIDGLHTKLNLR